MRVVRRWMYLGRTKALHLVNVCDCVLKSPRRSRSRISIQATRPTTDLLPLLSRSHWVLFFVFYHSSHIFQRRTVTKYAWICSHTMEMCPFVELDAASIYRVFLILPFLYLHLMRSSRIDGTHFEQWHEPNEHKCLPQNDKNEKPPAQNVCARVWLPQVNWKYGTELKNERQRRWNRAFLRPYREIGMFGVNMHSGEEIRQRIMLTCKI